MKKILFYGMNYAPELTGVGRYSGEIVQFMMDKGLIIEVITTPPHYPGWNVKQPFRNWYHVARNGKSRITRCPLLLRTSMTGLWRLLAPISFAIMSAPVVMWRIIITRPDVIVCVEPTLFAAPIALLFGKLLKIRTILHVQDLEIDAAFAVGHLKNKYIQNFACYLETKILRSFSTIITISNQMKLRIQMKGVDASRLYIIRNWVNLDVIKPIDAPNRYREELGIPDETFIVLYAGNIGKKQSLSLIVDAAKALVDHPEVLFIIAGDGPEKNRLIDRSLNLSNILFLPLQPEEHLCSLLNLADAHVLPQLKGIEDLVLPSKLGGMLASGKPCIVAADKGTELHEFLIKNALLVNTGNAKYIVNAVLDLSNSSKQFERAHLVFKKDQLKLCKQLSHKRQLPELLSLYVDGVP